MTDFSSFTDDAELDDVDPLAPTDDAPFGYTIDRATGERRPKKKAGRPRKEDEPLTFEPTGDTLEDLKARHNASERPKDREPGSGVKVRGGRQKLPKAVENVPFRAGPIAKGMNKGYLTLGKIVRGWDHDIGQAIIDATRKDTPDDTTVGEAWEELARTNPAVRRFLMKIVQGGAVTQLFWAHVPILLAIIMKPAIISRIPFGNVMSSWAEPDDTTPAGQGGLPGGMTQADLGDMGDVLGKQMAGFGFEMTPEMMQMAQSMMPQMRAPNSAPNHPRGQ